MLKKEGPVISMTPFEKGFLKGFWEVFWRCFFGFSYVLDYRVLMQVKTEGFLLTCLWYYYKVIYQ